MPCPYTRPAQPGHPSQRPLPLRCTPIQNTRTRFLNPNQQGTTAPPTPCLQTPTPPPRTIEILPFCPAPPLAALIFHAWLAAHDDQLRLASTLATQKQA